MRELEQKKSEDQKSGWPNPEEFGQGHAPSSASRPSAPPQAPAPAPPPPPPEEHTFPAPYTPRPAPSTSGGPRASAPKLYKSPEEILSKIAPPGCVIGLSFVDHRFNCRYAVKDDVLIGLAYEAPHKTASFAQRRTWQEALQTIHQFCWEKWGLVKANHPLPSDQVAQAPGEIPAEVLEALGPIIETLPPLKKAKKT